MQKDKVIIGLLNKASSFKLFGLFQPVTSFCCGCSLQCGILTIGIFSVIEAIRSIFTAISLFLTPASEYRLYSQIFVFMALYYFILAFFAFYSNNKQKYCKIFLILFKITYIFYLALFICFIFGAQIAAKIIWRMLPGSTLTENDVDVLGADESTKNLFQFFSAVMFVLVLIVGGYFLLAAHSYYVKRYLMRQFYSDFQPSDKQAAQLKLGTIDKFAQDQKEMQKNDFENQNIDFNFNTSKDQKF